MSTFNVPVEEYTTPNPVTANENTSIDDLRILMTENDIRHVLIVRNNDVVGVVSDRDLKVVSALDLKERSLVRAADIMSPDPVTVDSSATLDEVAMEMSKRKIGSVVVMEGHSLLGIFTVTDALNALIEISREI